MVEGFLRSGYRLQLAVSALTAKRKFGCDQCGATIEVWSPDDYRGILELKAGPESIERKIKCPQCQKENIRYWSKVTSLQGPLYLEPGE